MCATLTSPGTVRTSASRLRLSRHEALVYVLSLPILIPVTDLAILIALGSNGSDQCYQVICFPSQMRPSQTSARCRDPVSRPSRTPGRFKEKIAPCERQSRTNHSLLLNGERQRSSNDVRSGFLRGHPSHTSPFIPYSHSSAYTQDPARLCHSGIWTEAQRCDDESLRGGRLSGVWR